MKKTTSPRVVPPHAPLVSWPLDVQAKLARWAAAAPSRTFGQIFNLVHSPAVLTAAWKIVATSRGRGSAGVDGVRVRDVIHAGLSAFLLEIGGKLKRGTYAFSPLREVVIPKEDGSVRKLRIATVADRVVLVALRIVLEPLFEPRMSPNSLGFRPGRSVDAAVHQAASHLVALGNKGHVIVADVRDAFGSVDHVRFLETLAAVVTDKRVLSLVAESITSGLLLRSQVVESTTKGMPQGTPAAALFFNVAMLPVDAWLDTLASAGVRWCRYADDLRVFVPGPRPLAEEVCRKLGGQLAATGLSLSEEKTEIVHAGAGLDFLGTNIRASADPKSSGGAWVSFEPTARTISRFRGKVAKAAISTGSEKAVLEGTTNLIVTFLSRFPTSNTARDVARASIQEVHQTWKEAGGPTKQIPPELLAHPKRGKAKPQPSKAERPMSASADEDAHLGSIEGSKQGKSNSGLPIPTAPVGPPNGGPAGSGDHPPEIHPMKPKPHTTIDVPVTIEDDLKTFGLQVMSPPKGSRPVVTAELLAGAAPSDLIDILGRCQAFHDYMAEQAAGLASQVADLDRSRRHFEALVHAELRTAQVPRDDLAHRVQLDKRVRDAIDNLERAHRRKRAADVAVAILDRQLQTISRVVTIRRAEIEHLPTLHRPLHR